MPGTLLFGIDVESASPASVGVAQWGTVLFEQLETPVTYYVTGSTLQAYPEAFQEVDSNPWVEVQSHTYNHLLLKTVLVQVPPGKVVHNSTDWFMQRGGSVAEVEEDLTRCQELWERVLGRRATALTGPWCYYRGLGDRPDLLEIVCGLGFRALRCWGRDERDGQPTPLEWQPFFYRVQGFPEALEIMAHDYQDDFYWRMFVQPGPEDTYLEHLKTVADRVARDDLVWSMASHDHGCDTSEGFAQKGDWWREILEYAKGLGIRCLSVSQYYDERLKEEQEQG